MITEDHLQELVELLARAHANEGKLNDFERSWISEWEDKITTYGVATKISENQQRVFDRIDDKLKKHGE